MNPFNQSLGRRTVIKGAGLGLVAGGISAALPTETAVAAMEGGEIWSSEYWAKNGDVPLWMFRKRLGAPKQGEPSKPVLFFGMVPRSPRGASISTCRARASGPS